MVKAAGRRLLAGLVLVFGAGEELADVEGVPNVAQGVREEAGFDAGGAFEAVLGGGHLAE
jgi:hypothetical protein